MVEKNQKLPNKHICLHAFSSYKKRFYKKRLVELREIKKRRLVDLQDHKKRVS